MMVQILQAYVAQPHRTGAAIEPPQRHLEVFSRSSQLQQQPDFFRAKEMSA